MNIRKLDIFWWLWLPLALMAAQLGFEIFATEAFMERIMTEGGPHETAQSVVVFFGFIIACRALARLHWRECPWIAAWLLLAAMCCLYVAGEEQSWGQHVFDWATSEHWSAINDQGETNLHNTSSWLDQKPRIALVIGVFVGGLLIPLAQRFSPHLLPARFALIYPTYRMVPTALIVLFVKFIDKLGDMDIHIIFHRASEVEELYLFYFVVLYLIILRRRVMQHQS